ncbi:MAG: YHYH protein, partial [Myxococcota bacterium]|nr:YHYH protein [Myxococcota bacterium]
AATVINGELTTACLFKDYAWDNHSFKAQAGDAFLDECNGRVGPDGTYRYHATSSFPYLLGCFSGTVSSNLQPGCSDGGANSMTGPPR